MKLKSKNGYNIYYNESIPKNSNKIIIAMHGFCGDKKSSCISLLEEEALKNNIGLIKFDWPSHGESDTNDLSLDYCLSDLDTIIKYIKNKYPNSKLIAFSTSFGGYITLIYNYYNNKIFDKIILRSPAIKMYDVLWNNIIDNNLKNELYLNNYFNFGYDRLIKITNTFIDELKSNNIFEIYINENLNNISIIHGTNDDTVPINDSIEFAKIHNCTLYPIEGADHRYKKEGELEKVIKIATKLIKNK